jgi:hypothetical protein
MRESQDLLSSTATRYEISLLVRGSYADQEIEKCPLVDRNSRPPMYARQAGKTQRRMKLRE